MSVANGKKPRRRRLEIWLNNISIGLILSLIWLILQSEIFYQGLSTASTRTFFQTLQDWAPSPDLESLGCEQMRWPRPGLPCLFEEGGGRTVLSSGLPCSWFRVPQPAWSPPKACPRCRQTPTILRRAKFEAVDNKSQKDPIVMQGSQTARVCRVSW